MNLIFLDNSDSSQTLPLSDIRTQHLINVIKIDSNKNFYVGIPNGYRGLATVTKMDDDKIYFEVHWDTQSVFPLYDIECVVGLSRPQTCIKILQTLSSIGIKHIHFFIGDKSEKSYAASRLWVEEEWKKHVLAGAEQAFATTYPAVSLHDNLISFLELNLSKNLSSSILPICLDVYECSQSLSSFLINIQSSLTIVDKKIYLLIGSERGWSKEEREIIKRYDIPLVGIGRRIVRTETACTIAVSLVLSAIKSF